MKRLVKTFFMCIGMAIMLCGCNQGDTNHTGHQYEIGDALVVGTDKLPYSDEEIFEQLFDINNKIEIKIDITDEELLNIQKDYVKYAEKGSKSPIYREASMFITIHTKEDALTYYIKNIGIRMKGNTSRTDFYSEADGQYNLIHFRVKFMDDEFATLDNLELKWNKNDDTTYIREYYAYEMFRDYGILAPHVNLSTMEVAGVHQGVFSIYEPVDKNFINKNVAEEDQGGNLYKCAWDRHGADLRNSGTIGVENEEAGVFFNYDLKTNKKEADHTLLRNLLTVLNKRNLTKEKLVDLVNMDNFLMFSAVSYFVGNPDDMRNNYNNYYIYFLKSSGKAIFIPYDQDRVLGITKDWNPSGDAMTSVSPFSTKASGANSPQKNPLYTNTVDRENGKFLEEYTVALKRVAEGEWLTTEKFDSLYEIARANYAEDTKPEKVFWNAENHSFLFDLSHSDGFGTEYGNASFKAYLDAKLKTYRRLVE